VDCDMASDYDLFQTPDVRLEAFRLVSQRSAIETAEGDKQLPDLPNCGRLRRAGSLHF